MRILANLTKLNRSVEREKFHLANYTFPQLQGTKYFTTYSITVWDYLCATSISSRNAKYLGWSVWRDMLDEFLLGESTQEHDVRLHKLLAR